MKCELVNAQQAHAESPETFKVPYKKDLEELSHLDNVQVANQYERFWGFIIKIQGEKLMICIDNHLEVTELHGLKFMDHIEITRDHIYKIREHGARDPLPLDPA